MDFLSLFGHGGDLRRQVERRRAALFRLAHLWCQDRSLADDLTQDALAKAIAAAGQLRDQQRLDSWLYGILANCWRDHLRSLRPAEDIDAVDERWLAADAAGPEQAASRGQLAARVRLAVAQLPLGQREVLSLVDLGECSYAEVAAILGVPIGTVMSRLSRARAQLRVSLAGTLEPASSAGMPPASTRLRRLK